MTAENAAAARLQAALDAAVSLPDIRHGAQIAGVSDAQLRDWAALALREAGPADAAAGSELTTAVIVPALRMRLNASLPRRLDDRVRSSDIEFDPDFGPEHTVWTPAMAQLAATLKSMRGGAIGIVGPPGAGKTWLMETACAGNLSGTDNARWLGIVTTVRDDTTPRELVLDLLERLSRVVGGVGQRRSTAISAHMGLSELDSASVWLVSLLTGVALLILSALDVQIQPQTAIGMGLLAAGAIGLASRVQLRDHRARGEPSLSERAARLYDLVVDERRFETTITSEWSVGVKAPLGLESGRTGGVTRKQRPRDFGELAELFRVFVSEVTTLKDVWVAIGLDGLDDRASGEDVRRFVQDIRPLIGCPRCFVLVTLPDVSMTSGRRRLHLDELIRLQLLDLSLALSVIDRHVIGLPRPLGALCYSLSGGLLADLKRALWDLIDVAAHHDAVTAGRATSQVIDEEIAYLSAELLTVAANSDWATQAALAPWVERLRKGQTTAESLLAQCRELEHAAALQLAGSTDPSIDADASLRILFSRAIGLCYLDATLLEVFTDNATSTYWTTLLEERKGAASVDALAEARAQIDRGAHAHAWSSISKFREAWDLEVIEMPSSDVAP
jgi:hypothetical protein